MKWLLAKEAETSVRKEAQKEKSAHNRRLKRAVEEAVAVGGDSRPVI